MVGVDPFWSSFDTWGAKACLEQISFFSTRTEITICLEPPHDLDQRDRYDYDYFSKCIRQLGELFEEFKLLLQSGYVLFIKFAAREQFEFRFKIELEELNEQAWCDKVASLKLLE
jgi:hypothetical protein